MEFDLEYIQKLANILKDNNLTEITLEDVDRAIVLKKEAVVTAVQSAPAVQVQTTQPEHKATAEEPKTEKKGHAVVSPMVGTFYRAPGKDEPPFVEVGDIVKDDQTVCIIEAMKLMNEIEAEVSGKVTEICVKDGETVEFGQVLMYIE